MLRKGDESRQRRCTHDAVATEVRYTRSTEGIHQEEISGIETPRRQL